MDISFELFWVKIPRSVICYISRYERIWFCKKPPVFLCGCPTGVPTSDEGDACCFVSSLAFGRPAFGLWPSDGSGTVLFCFQVRVFLG